LNTAQGVAFEIKLKASKFSDSSGNYKFPTTNVVKESKASDTSSNDQFFLRIFLMDDDKYVYEYFKDLISKSGLKLELDFFSDPVQAEEALVKKRYDLHLIDYDLGNGIIGTDFAKAHLSFLKDGLVIHSSREMVILPSNACYEKKPIGLTDFKQLCLETYKTRFKVLLVEDSRLIAIAWKIAPSLDRLSLGDATAFHLGINVARIRLIALVALSILAGGAVSTVGSIAFIGLAAPHIARFIYGPAHRNLVAHSAVIGALIVVVADTVSRTIAQPNELPIGLATALLGAPVLIALVTFKNNVWRTQ
jgi:hypothetical protein